MGLVGKPSIDHYLGKSLQNHDRGKWGSLDIGAVWTTLSAAKSNLFWVVFLLGKPRIGCKKSAILFLSTCCYSRRRGKQIFIILLKIKFDKLFSMEIFEVMCVVQFIHIWCMQTSMTIANHHALLTYLAKSSFDIYKKIINFDRWGSLAHIHRGTLDRYRMHDYH